MLGYDARMSKREDGHIEILVLLRCVLVLAAVVLTSGQ